jgi:ZIP family zinc transporter
MARSLIGMIEAGFWGAAGGAALVVGAFIALRASLSARTVGLIMGFGAGVLISAVAYELIIEAIELAAGTGATAVGLAVGALTFFAGDTLITRRGQARRSAVVNHFSESPPPETSSVAAAATEGGQAIALGAILDGIPESIVVGASLLGGAGVSIALVAAVFISNVPESIAATDDLMRGGMPPGRIIRMWVILTAIFGLSAALGYLIIGALPGTVQAFVEAFAGGALLTMLADSMIPEAYERARLWAGLCLVLGFALALGLAALESQT